MAFLNELEGIRISVGVGISVGVVLLTMWTAVFVRIWRGNQIKWLLKVTAMLLVSSFGMIAFNFFTIPMLKTKQWELRAIWEVEITNSLLMYLPFNVSHLMLAYHYIYMSRTEGPNKKSLRWKKRSPCERWTYWFLLGANVVCPFIQCFASISYRTAEHVQDD